MNRIPRSEYFDLFSFFSLLWQKKWHSLLVVGVMVGLMILKLEFTQSEYKAEIVLAPNSGVGSNAVSKLASFAGFSGSEGVSEKDLGMVLLESRAFLASFAINHGLQKELLAAFSWDRATRKITYNPDIYDEEKGLWASPQLKNNEWALSNAILKGLNVSEDPSSGIVYLQYYHYSPEFTVKLLDALVLEINRNLKQRMERKSKNRIAELTKAFDEVEFSALQSLIFKLLEDEIQKLALAGGPDDYAFEIVSAATLPVVPARPNRKLYILISVLLGLVLALLFILIADAVRSRR